MRRRLEAAANPRSLKRGRGGIVDVEFVVQLLQLKYGRETHAILEPNIWDAIDALETAALLPVDDAAALRSGYAFLRLVEARLRIVTDRPLTQVPDSREDQAKLARRLGFDTPERFLEELRGVQDNIRSRFNAILSRERK
jgi:glutamate-ammonia-ligase adenylyltransferase